METELKWVVVDFGETMIYLPIADEERIQKHFMDKDECIELEDITGKVVHMDFKKVQCIYTSTPETRRRSYIQQKEGDIEKANMLRDAGYTDYDD